MKNWLGWSGVGLTLLMPAHVVMAASDYEVGYMVGKYMGAAAFVEKTVERCPVFSNNKITLERAHQQVIDIMPPRLVAKMESADMVKLARQMADEASEVAEKLFDLDDGKMSADLRCGMLMGYGLTNYIEGRQALNKEFGGLEGLRP